MREPVAHGVVEMLGLLDVFEVVLAEISHADAVGHGVLDQCSRAVAEQRLPAAARGGDARGAVHVQADVVVAAKRSDTGVHPDAHPNVGAPWPGAAGQCDVRLDRSSQCRRCGREDHEERVTFGANHRALVSREGVAKQQVVLLQQRPEVLPELLEQACAALDVAEQEGDRPGGQVARVAHTASIRRPSMGPSGAPETGGRSLSRRQ